MTRSLAFVLSLFALLPSLTTAAEPRLDTLQALLATERQLAKEAQERYLNERLLQTEAFVFAESAWQDLDSALDGQLKTPLAELERLRTSTDAASVAAEYASRQAQQARRDLFSRKRRIEALERQVRAILLGGNPNDPVTGQWRVSLGSPVTEAVFELQLNGTLVAGSFRIGEGSEEGPSGSLRGTYAGGQLNLERVDEDGGIAGIYLGTVDSASGRASGIWNPNDLSAGGPGMIGWSAERIVPETVDDESDDGAN